MTRFTATYLGRSIITTLIFTVVLGAQEPTRVKTALVLSGGGARGFVHVGVIKALEEIGFYPDLIVGTSVGAIVGALYASGNTPEQIEKLVTSTRWSKLLTPKPFRDIEFVSQKIMELPALFALRFDENFNVIYPKNLLSTQALQERIFQETVYPEFAARADFDSLAIPLRIVATDIKTGKTVVIKQGNLAKAVTSSSAFPIALAPVAYDSMLLVDGGLTNNVPCDVARELGAEFIIAVDASSKVLPLKPNFDVLEIFGQAMNTLSFMSDTRNLELADVLIRPQIDQISAADFDSVSVLVEAGYRSTLPYLENIRPYATNQKKDPDFLARSQQELNQTTIRSITFNNNRITRNFVMRREMQLQEGAPWNSALARRSMKNLFSTGLFKNVYMSLRKVGQNQADVMVEVEEEARTLFSFGTHYDSERKASAFLQAKYNNLLGTGLDNQVFFIASDLLRKIEWDARSTRILISNFTGYTSLYYRYETVPLYDDGRRVDFGEHYRLGLEANAGLQIKRVGLTAFGIKLEKIHAYKSVVDPLRENDYTSFSLVSRIFVDNTDDHDLPRNGRLNDLRYEHSVSEDNFKQFDRISVESSNYETYSDKYTFSTHIRIGYINVALSHYEKFRLGGLHSLPGWHQDELWGNLVGTVGLGLRAPLTSGIFYRLYGTFGNVWEGIDNFNWRDSRMAVSAGIVIPTPVGPISLDYGYDLRDRNLLYFSIGHLF